MSYNGSGSFTINSTGQPVVDGTDITATVHNALTADLASGLSNAICKDGQTTVTANIPFGGNKLTGVGAATARTDAASLATIQDGTGVYVATVGGTADVITLTVSPAITSYAAGQVFYWIASGANTTSVTVNVSGLGAKALTKDGSTALVANDILSGALIGGRYDGTRFQLIARPTVSAAATLTNKTLALGSNTISGTTAQFNTALSDGDFATLAGTETLTAKTINLTSNTLSGTTAQFNTALSDGDFATLAGTETLTAKTINLTSNTLSGTTAQFNTALSDNDFATLAGTETLTNKTLTTPSISTPTFTGTFPQVIGTGQLKTATGSYSGTGPVDVVMNDYAFSPALTQAGGASGTALSTVVIADPGTTVGRISVQDTGGNAVNVRWRYMTASDEPTIWALIDSATGEIKGTWVSDDPLSTTEETFKDDPVEGLMLVKRKRILTESPIASPGLLVQPVPLATLAQLALPQGMLDAADRHIERKQMNPQNRLYRALQFHTRDLAPSSWLLNNCAWDHAGGVIRELSQAEKAQKHRP